MKKLNTTLIYVLSSLSLLCCCFFGLGILLALPSFLIANKKFKEVEEFADEYEMEDLKTINTAKTFAIVALTINGVFLLYSIYNLTTTDWDIVKQQYLDAIEQYQQ